MILLLALKQFKDKIRFTSPVPSKVEKDTKSSGFNFSPAFKRIQLSTTVFPFLASNM